MSQPVSQPIQYPTPYVFKVIGRQENAFSEHMRAFFTRVTGTEPAPDAWEERASEHGKFLSVSVTVVLASEDERKNIYSQLQADSRVVYYL